MPVYSVDKLMAETRKLAAEYHRTTQQALPVSGELAKYDACRFLNLKESDKGQAGVDAYDENKQAIQIKCRVIFDESKSGYRVGQLKLEGEWQQTVLVLMDADYQAIEIYAATRNEIEQAMSDGNNEKRSKRGVMSVAKFKAIGKLAWTREDGVESA